MIQLYSITYILIFFFSFQNNMEIGFGDKVQFIDSEHTKQE
jgi:hypothetical protein